MTEQNTTDPSGDTTNESTPNPSTTSPAPSAPAKKTATKKTAAKKAMTKKSTAKADDQPEWSDPEPTEVTLQLGEDGPTVTVTKPSIDYTQYVSGYGYREIDA